MDGTLDQLSVSDSLRTAVMIHRLRKAVLHIIRSCCHAVVAIWIVLMLMYWSGGVRTEMVLPERPELAFRPHNLQSNQLATPQSAALYDAASKADVNQV